MQKSYEQIRQARIEENKIKLATLGVQKTLTELKSLGPKKTQVRIARKVDYSSNPLRRSSRVKGETIQVKGLPYIGTRRIPTFGFFCHFCRRQRRCDEKDCKPCADFYGEQPCIIGKTECSICHSSTGIFCRDCLKVRYGEELEEVRADKQWACPHCIEEKGTKPYWICNSSLCLQKRNMAFDETAIYGARRRMGYKSVAHLFMDQLKKDGWMMMPGSVVKVKHENI